MPGVDAWTCMLPLKARFWARTEVQSIKARLESL
eukprot:CAMPEP_0170585194 /NCGR_PEP_ID=MMETSP0224-20130122/9082_1 /TAXON_ID=285029 /ORGANISM="Togula jolla, Strain CCCM 725" /LENGTH=33 /DNA_ID= /DNA_START= /DNA_END= /DNA_ORIENTATION=